MILWLSRVSESRIASNKPDDLVDQGRIISRGKENQSPHNVLEYIGFPSRPRYEFFEQEIVAFRSSVEVL